MSLWLSGHNNRLFPEEEVHHLRLPLMVYRGGVSGGTFFFPNCMKF